MHEVMQNVHGIPCERSSLEDLDYADDIALLSNSHDDIQRSIDILNVTPSQVGFKINIGKTKIMRINDSHFELFM